MAADAYDLSAGLFVRGLTNLKAQLTKAEYHAAASGSGEAALLDAPLAGEGRVHGTASDAGTDLHLYTLAAQVHWASEGARLAIAQLLGTPRVPAPNDARALRICTSVSMPLSRFSERSRQVILKPASIERS